jgi:hypothetical protein
LSCRLQRRIPLAVHNPASPVAFSGKEKISKRLVARQPKFDPQNPPIVPPSAPRFLSQPSHAPLTNTPTRAFHLQPCQSYKGSSYFLGVSNSKCHQQKQIYPVSVLRQRTV